MIFGGRGIDKDSSSAKLFKPKILECAHTDTLGWRRWGEKRAESRSLLMCCVLKPLLALISHQANANGQAWMEKTHTSTHRGAHVLKTVMNTKRRRRSRWKR